MSVERHTRAIARFQNAIAFIARERQAHGLRWLEYDFSDPANPVIWSDLKQGSVTLETIDRFLVFLFDPYDRDYYVCVAGKVEDVERELNDTDCDVHGVLDLDLAVELTYKTSVRLIYPEGAPDA